MKIVGPHGDLCDVDVSVAHGSQTKVFLGRWFASGSEFCHSPQRSSLGGLAAGVGIDLGVQHQNVDVLARSQDVVEATVSYVVCPAIAADYPYAFFDQVVAKAH